MYLTNIEIKNIGPIDQLNLEIQAPKGRAPLPLVFVGTNGSGKSLVLAQIVSALINAHNSTYEDSDTEKGRLFKLMHRSYIRHGSNYSYSDLKFTDGIFEREIILDRPKEDFEKIFAIPFAEDWQQTGPFEGVNQVTDSRPDHERIRRALSGPHLYFPPNRFEEPAWVNLRDLRNTIEYPDIERISGLSNRKIIEHTPMKNNQSWLLDVFLESNTVERKSVLTFDGNQQIEQAGPATYLMEYVENFILSLFDKTGKPTWNLGRRSNRTISFISNDRTLIKNFLALSTGESLILNFFITILRHADWSLPRIDKLEEIKGLVVIDEVDLHLHADFQFRILPKLFSIFPNIQFIMSSHSPFFVLGLEKELGESEYTIVNLPDGLQISAERYSGFKRAYELFSGTRKHEEELVNAVKKATKPILFVEGEIDRDYITKAAEVLEKSELLSMFEIQVCGGSGNLNKIWKNFPNRLTNPSQVIILLYDCDENVKDESIGKTFRKNIPFHDSEIKKGIENLLPQSTIDRAKEHKLAFFDCTPKIDEIKRGKTVSKPEMWSVNSDEKRYLCNWICQDGKVEDFEQFNIVFEILTDCLVDHDSVSNCSELRT